MKYHHLYDHGSATKKNVLLFGPPGTGKTLVAKILAEETGLSFLNVKGPELLNMYVGQSEQAIRCTFRKAKENQPSLLFFDEVESIASERSSGHGPVARMVSQLILEFDAMRSSKSVFIIGASNRPDMLDTSLLRPGRFDTLLYMGIDATLERRIKLLDASTRQMCLSSDVKLDEIAKHCDPLCSGADIYGLSVRAWILAAKRHFDTPDVRALPRSDQQPVYVSSEDFITSAASITTSIVFEDVAKYEELRDRYESTI
jgi:peroxin-6